ncbi:hypothetical protein IQ268_08490 [Oculatella sp. LEGE 06141]|uniref:hypothetical protein n=1 Tax=Oculatella sp. LEGE 06141 TaxID=1828648 RepID=UPI001882EFBA|nr:hypothetical protein [Oculatella sp. LEGE 06141]MBE9178595.1 hypothetical protein [Oculatella sp. LEGE 06141]
MKKALPFLVAPKTEIRAIGTPEVGIVHLLKRGGISPCENPVDLQEAGNRQAKVQLILQQAIKRLAQEEGISKSEARKRLFAMPTKDAADGSATDEEMPSLYDHLSADEAADLLNLREDTASTAIKAASLFIRHRVAYPVQLVVPAKATSTSLTVEPLSFAIADGQKIKFGYLKVEVDGAHEVGAEVVTIKSLAQNLADEAIGYLCEFETGKLMIGDADWTEDHTRECLTEELIIRIYNFYQAEMTGLAEQEEAKPAEDAEGKNLASDSSSALPAAAQ